MSNDEHNRDLKISCCVFLYLYKCISYTATLLKYVDVLNAIYIKITDNLTEFLIKDTAERTSLLFFLMIMMLLLLCFHYHAVYKVLQEESVIQRHRVIMTLIY